MKKPDIPRNETQRMVTLCSLDVLDTPAEARFDRFTRIAQQHFKVSIALVSLVDIERQWFKSRQGLDATETPRDISFCGHAILNEDIFYIPNALEDPRFADNPLVTDAPYIRFYAGAPLHAPDGQSVGTLCIIDDKPRKFSADELSVLRDLADGVEAELERTSLIAAAKKATQLAMVAERTDNAIIITDAKGVIEWVNHGFQCIAGYTLEEAVGKKLSALMQERDTDPATVTLMEEKISTGEGFKAEMLNYHKDGTPCWLAISAQPIHDNNNRLINFIYFESDISKSKESEIELQSRENRIRAIVDTVVDGIIVINARGSIQTFNPAAEKLFGYCSDEVQGQNVNILMPDPYAEEHDGYLHNYLTTGERKIIGIGREVTGKRKDGSTFPMELAVSEMEVTGERMFTGIVRDISERKRDEAGIQARENRIRAIVDTVVDGIIVIDTMGCIETFNPAAEKLFGYLSAEIRGQNVNTLMPQPYAREHDGYLYNYFATGVRKIIGIGREVTGKRKDGSTFPMELAVSEMEVSGKRMFTGIVRDITERKKVERMKSEFISTVSHELRTPLTSIRGALGLVLGKGSDQLPGKARKMLEMANRNSERLTLLINDILDLEKIDSGQMEFEFKTIDLVTLARQALEDNEGYAQQHQVSMELASTLSQALVLGDQHRLLQVFANLISNAIKYSPRDGMVEISVMAQDEVFRVMVRDHGAGIPDKFRSRIFQRFTQADSSDTRDKGGTGLGLSIAKAIIEVHEGQIDYNSKLGEGTTFYFDLPALQTTIEEAADTVSGIRVLICEDDPDVATVLAEMLKSEDMSSDIAASAEAARRLLDSHTYRLMLLDLTLPDTDGLQFLRELRAVDMTANLPVIVVSGRAQEGRIEFKGDAVTVVDWIQKPIEQARLEHALREALHRTERPHILHVEDDPDIIQITHALIEDMADLSHVPSLSEARQQLAIQEFDLVILDLGLADGSGVELLDELKGRCPVVIFSAQHPNRDITAQVTAALTKSRTSNEQLLATIKKILDGSAQGSM